MSMPLVTEQSVHNAADALKAEGKTVSYRAIRERLGGGSPDDILTHLRTWLAKEANTHASHHRRGHDRCRGRETFA